MKYLIFSPVFNIISHIINVYICMFNMICYWRTSLLILSKCDKCPWFYWNCFSVNVDIKIPSWCSERMFFFCSRKQKHQDNLWYVTWYENQAWINWIYFNTDVRVLFPLVQGEATPFQTVSVHNFVERVLEPNLGPKVHTMALPKHCDHFWAD